MLVTFKTDVGDITLFKDNYFIHPPAVQERGPQGALSISC